MYRLLVFLLVASVVLTDATTSCSTGFTGSSCQYQCSTLCNTQTSCVADRCDVPRCQCSGYGSVDQTSGQCVCITGRSGDVCEFAISETICSQSQTTGRFAQPSGTSTCPAAPAAATAVCVNASITYAVSTRGAFEWPNPYPCFPPITDGLLLWPISVAAAYVSPGKRDEFTLLLHTESGSSLLENSYWFAFVPFSWSTDPTQRIYTIHSNYEHSRTLEVDGSGPDPSTGRIRVFLSATRLANPTTWYACTVGTCAIMPVRYPGYGLNVNMTTRTVFVSNQTVQWTTVSDVPVVSGTFDVILNRTLTSVTTITGALNQVDCLSHAVRYYTKRAATWYADTKVCDLASEPYYTSASSGGTAITYIMDPGNLSGRKCGSRRYAFPNDADAPDSVCTKKFIGPTRLVYGAVFGSVAATTMLVADIASSTVRMRNLTATPSASEYFFWNITDETGMQSREVTISVAFLPPDVDPLCLAIDSSNNILLLTCNTDDQRTMWFMGRATGEFMQGFSLRPSLFTEASGVALEVQPGSGGFNIRLASGHPSSVFDPTINWAPWLRGTPAAYAGVIDGFIGLDVTSFIGVYGLFTGVLMAVGTYDRAQCISLCAARQPDCVAAKIGVAGTCSIWKFDDSQPSPDGRLEHSLFTATSSTVVHYIMNPEPFKSLVQTYFPPRNNSDCLWRSGYFAVKGGTLGVDSIGASLFSETKYRNGYYCVNSLDIGPALLVNIDFDDGASVGVFLNSNSHHVVIGSVDSISAVDTAETMFVVIHATGEPYIYTIHNAMAEEMTLEADLSLLITETSRPVTFSKASRGSPMKWKLNTIDVSAGIPLSFEAYDLPGWFLQMDAPFGLPPAGLIIKRAHGRGYNTWFVQFGFQNGGNLGVMTQGVKGAITASDCLNPPDNDGVDAEVSTKCFFDIPTPGACLTVCAYQQNCRAAYFDASLATTTCRVFTQLAFDAHAASSVVTNSGFDFFAYHGNAWYSSRCLVDNYAPIVSSGIGPDTNSAETWLRTYYSGSKCKRRVTGPFLLFERTGVSAPSKVGSRYNVGDFGTPDSTKHYEFIDCADPSIPFDYTSGCNDGITINSRSLIALEQVAYDQYYMRIYWKTFHGAETQASSRYLFVDPATNNLRVTDFTGYRPAMFNGFRKFLHDGRQYSTGDSFAATHGDPVRILLAGELAIALTLNNATHRVTVAPVSSLARQSWSVITPGFQSTRWKYSYVFSDANVAQNVIGVIGGVVDAAQCSIFCFANKRCQQASHDAGTSQCTILRRAGYSTVYTFTGNAANTVYTRPVLSSLTANDMDTGGINTGICCGDSPFVSFIFGNVGSCGSCVSTGSGPGLTGESEGGSRPIMFSVGGPLTAFPQYFWQLDFLTAGTTPGAPHYTGGIKFDRNTNAQGPFANGFQCFADSSRCRFGTSTPNWCCQHPSTQFYRYYTDNSIGGCGEETQFMFIELPDEYNDGFPRVQAHQTQTQDRIYRTDRSARYAITVFIKTATGTVQSRPDQFLCMTYQDPPGIYFSNNQYDPDCVVYAYYTCRDGNAITGSCTIPA